MNIQGSNADYQSMVQEGSAVSMQKKAIDNMKLQGQQVNQLIASSSVQPVSDPTKGNLINLLA